MEKTSNNPEKPARDPMARRLRRHLQGRMLSGLLILIPAVITLLILRLIFNFLLLLVSPLNDWNLGKLPEPVMATLALIILLALVYLLGSMTRRMFGRKLLSLFERMVLRVPLVKSVYGASKQVIEAVRATNKKAFKGVAVVEFPKSGSYALAFITGELKDQNGANLISVFLPTTPNPTSGYLLILREDQISHTDLSVEEGIKMIISGGVLVPPVLGVPTGNANPACPQQNPPSLQPAQPKIPSPRLAE